MRPFEGRRILLGVTGGIASYKSVMLARLLRTQGYTVTQAENAEKARQALDVSRPNLVISDIVMPGLSGLELLEAVRARVASLRGSNRHRGGIVSRG